jgi:hypothetical protein
VDFKAQVESDLPGVFLNPAEFGEPHTIDGAYPLICVIDDEVRSEHSAEGVYLSETVLHVRVVDIPVRPVVGQRMLIDERSADVRHVAENMGLLSIRVGWFES